MKLVEVREKAKKNSSKPTKTLPKNLHIHSTRIKLEVRDPCIICLGVTQESQAGVEIERHFHIFF